MKTAVQISACLALLSVAWLCLVTAGEVKDFQVNALGEIGTEGAATREMVAEQVAVLTRVTDARLASIQTDLGKQITATRTAAVEQIGFTRADLVTQISLTRAALDSQLTATNASVARAVTGTESVSASTMKALDQINAGLPNVLASVLTIRQDLDILGKCEDFLPDGTPWGNPDCFPNRLIPVMKAVEKSADQVPALTSAITGIAVDLHREADELVKPKKWWQKLLSPILIGGRLAAAFL